MIFGLLVLMNFNNCGVYESEVSDANNFQAASLQCETENTCVVKSNINLKIEPLPLDNFPVSASLEAFNIGGNCNEAGFDSHQIVWNLRLNNQVVRTSSMIMLGASRNSTCVNGKFRVFVYLGSIAEDPVNRIGLMYGAGGAARAAYDLQFEILGRDSGTTWYRNTNQGGVRSITLAPL